ncbi:MAG: hypothetical protein U1C71_04300, partial [archaeon]|nr:hypothetical protein [archaeon]
MSEGGWILLLVILVALAATGNLFWLIAGGLLFLVYMVFYSTRTITRGAKKGIEKAKKIYEEEYHAMEAAKGSHPKGTFENIGKALSEKTQETILPKGAKSYKDAYNYQWNIPQPMHALATMAEQFWD